MEEKTYSFQLSKRSGVLRQGVIWEEFLKRIGINLGYKKPIVNRFGGCLVVNNQIVLEGYGGVGNKGGYTYYIKKVSEKIKETLDAAVNKSIQEMQEKKGPTISQRITSFFYPLL